MASDIDSYLAELSAELAGADPAVIQDALYDAEEYLRNELTASVTAAAAGAAISAQAAGTVSGVAGTEAARTEAARQAAFAAAVERYGSPAEVAAAYRSAEAQPGAVPAAGAAQAASAEPKEALGAMASGDMAPADMTAVRVAGGQGSAAARDWVRETDRGQETNPFLRFLSVIVDGATYRSLAYMFIAFATGIVYFTIAVTGISLSAGLIVLIVGPLVALGFLAVVRGLALAEGRIVEALLGVRMPRRPRLQPQGMTLVQRIKYWLNDRRSWTALLYMILQMPLGVVYFTVTVVGLSIGLYGIAVPILQISSGHIWIQFEGGGYHNVALWEYPLWVLGGAIVILLTLHLVWLLGRWHGVYAKAMLVKLGWPQPVQPASPAVQGVAA